MQATMDINHAVIGTLGAVGYQNVYTGSLLIQNLAYGNSEQSDLSK